jgi:hypothetical protein
MRGSLVAAGNGNDGLALTSSIQHQPSRARRQWYGSITLTSTPLTALHEKPPVLPVHFVSVHINFTFLLAFTCSPNLYLLHCFP